MFVLGHEEALDMLHRLNRHVARLTMQYMQTGIFTQHGMKSFWCEIGKMLAMYHRPSNPENTSIQRIVIGRRQVNQATRLYNFFCAFEKFDRISQVLDHLKECDYVL